MANSRKAARGGHASKSARAAIAAAAAPSTADDPSARVGRFEPAESWSCRDCLYSVAGDGNPKVPAPQRAFICIRRPPRWRGPADAPGGAGGMGWPIMTEANACGEFALGFVPSLA